MKKLVSTLILTIFFSAICFAQWRVINPGEKYNYLHSTQGDSIVRTTIWVDSVKIENGDSVYYLNKVFQDKGILSGTFMQNPLFVINQSQFLKSKITFLSNNVQHIEGDRNWFLNGNCSIGDSWIFDSTANKTAYCDSIFEMNFFGITDSVKRIEVDMTDTILLSKYYGVISFPDLDTINQKYNLVGLEIQNLGLTVPRAYDFCNFNVGDEFEYESGGSSYFSGSNPHYSSSIAFYRYIILVKSISIDSITYQISKKFRLENHPFGGGISIQVDSGIIDTIVYKLSNAGNYLNEQFNRQYSYQQGLIYWSVFEKDTIGSGYRKHYSSSICSGYGQDSILIGPTNPVAYHQNSSDDNSQLLGLLSMESSSGTGGFGGSGQGDYKQLLACTINGVQYGQYQPDNIYHDCSLDTICNNYIVSDKDTLIDADTTAILHSAFQASSYLWSTGATTDSITTHHAGVYTLSATNDYGCTKVSTKHIYAYHNVDSNSIVASTLKLCDNNDAVLSSKLNGFNYLWSTGSTASSIIVNSAGIYSLTTTDSYGFSSVKSVTVGNTLTTPFNWPDDTVINNHGSVILKIPWVYDTYLWNDSDNWYIKNFNYSDLNIGVNKIWASAYKNNCIESDTILIIRSPDESAVEENFEHFFFIENSLLYFMPADYNCLYQLYYMEGQLILTKNSLAGMNAEPINLKSLNTGIYFLRITTSKKSYTGKIFITH